MDVRMINDAILAAFTKTRSNRQINNAQLQVTLNRI